MAEQESFDQSEVWEQDFDGFLSAVAPCKMYSLGSCNIKVQISQITCSQLERADHFFAKSFNRKHDSADFGSKVLSRDEKRDKYQAAVVQKNQN